MSDQFVSILSGINKKLVEKIDPLTGRVYYAEEVHTDGGSSSSTGSSVEVNYSTRLIKDAVTGVTIAETRTIGLVTQRQNWIYNASGAYLGVDAWVIV